MCWLGLVFEKPEAGWTDKTETAKLTAPDDVEYHYFGRSVSIRGDTIVVGASGDGDSGYRSGSAYAFPEFEPITCIYLPVVLRNAP